MINLLQCIIPFNYFIRTRLSRRFQQISFAVIYLIPYVLYILCNYSIFDLFSFLQTSFSILIVNYVYETGYLQNDIITIRKENTPTQRLDKNSLKILSSCITIIFLIRAFLTFCFAILLFLFGCKYAIIIITLSFLLQVLFYTYNSNRSYLNLFLLPLLTFLRFYTPLIPFLLMEHNFSGLIYLFFLYPFLRFFEFTKEHRFKISVLSSCIPSVDVLRVYYFLLITILGFFFLDEKNIFILYSCLAYLVYRSLGLFLIKTNESLLRMLTSSTKKEFRK